MSASVLWRPVKQSNRRINTGAGAALFNCLQRIFGGERITLSEADMQVLVAMGAVYADCMPNAVDNPYQQLIDAVEACGRIEVWAEY